MTLKEQIMIALNCSARAAELLIQNTPKEDLVRKLKELEETA
jgi:hypothetical protein